MGTALPRVERASERLTWHALAGADRVGAVRAISRPDERLFVVFESCRADAYEPLLAAVARELPGDLYLTIDDTDSARRRLCEGLGFVVNRRESHYRIPTDPDITGLGRAEPPTGFALVSAGEVDLDRLRRLDDVLRQDVPGTDGWAWDEAGFREELAPPSFDPGTYLVAVEEASGAYVGIVRVWLKTERPRLGFVGVLPAFRRRGLARALLARAFAVLDERGEPEVSTEIDDENVPSRALLEPLCARRTGGSLELIRRPG